MEAHQCHLLPSNLATHIFFIFERATGKYRYLVGHIATQINIGILLVREMRIGNELKTSNVCHNDLKCMG